VDFERTFPSEQQALFDIIAGADDVISVAELDAAMGLGHGVAEDLTTVQQLVELFDVSAVTAGPQTNLERILAADADADEKFDPAGLEVATGATSLYISEEQRRIRASADDVLINVSEFLYLKGSVALDIGSRETVQIRTGIPAEFGSIAAGAIPQINGALSDLNGLLTGLRTDFENALASGVMLIKTTIEGAVEDIVDTIEQTILNIAMNVTDAIESVTNDVTTLLEGATSSLNADGILDTVIQTVISKVPDGPLKPLVEILVEPIKSVLASYFKDTIDDALTGAIDKISASITGAFQAGVQSLAAQIRAEIHRLLDPQIARVLAQLDRLVVQIQGALNPIFDKLLSISNIRIGSAFSTVDNVDVDVTALGVSNATAFVGLPPADGLDFDTAIADQDAVGFFIDDFSMGLGMFKPVLGEVLPSFTAAKIMADAAGFTDGDRTDDVLEMIAREIEVQLNLGGPIIPGIGALFGNATIDFLESFPASAPDPAGYAAPTGTTTEPILLDFPGGELIAASVGDVSIKISEFVHIKGSVAFEKGRTEPDVAVTGGLLSGVSDLAGEFLAMIDPNGDLPLDSIPAVGATETELTFLTIGAANVHAFVGFDGPYWTADIDGSRTISWSLPALVDGMDGDDWVDVVTYNSTQYGDINMDGIVDANETADPTMETWRLPDISDGTVVTFNSKQYGDLNSNTKVDADETAELSEAAVGLVIDDFDFGMAIMSSTNPLDFVKYFALKASANQVKMVGIEGVTVEANDLLVEINQSSPSIYALPLFPVVDFANTPQFASEQLLFDEDDSGSLTLGDLVRLNTTHSAGFGELDSIPAADYGTPVDHDTLLSILNTDDTGDSQGVIDYVEAAALLGGDTPALDAAEAADADGDGKIDPLGYEVNTGGDPVYLSMDSGIHQSESFGHRLSERKRRV
jgi:hypothetical protein